MPKAGLFHVNIRSCDPANLGSADAALVGMGDDGFDYVIKTVEKTPNVPASEWLCHRLSELCNIVVPQYAILNIPKMKPAFGSRYDSAFETNTLLILDILSGQEKANILAERLSAIYAFDLFVHNDDRHFGNYMFTKAMNGYSVKAFDFSRAWLHHGWPLPDLPLHPSCNTVDCFRDLIKHHQFNLKAADVVLDRLSELNVGSIQNIHTEMPTEWLPKPSRNKIIKWWPSKDRLERIEFIRGGLKDGTLL
jgi:hypothetical protein